MIKKFSSILNGIYLGQKSLIIVDEKKNSLMVENFISCVAGMSIIVS
jgi:hypothetical protein